MELNVSHGHWGPHKVSMEEVKYLMPTLQYRLLGGLEKPFKELPKALLSAQGTGSVGEELGKCEDQV